MTAATLAQQLSQIEADLSAREAAMAAALEQLSQDAAVQAAYRAGADAAIFRVLLLIAARIDQLQSGGLNSISLQALKTAIMQ